jgi:TolA-binding protein
MKPVRLPRITIRQVIWLVLVVVSPWGRAGLSDLEQIPLATFEQMREVERYQLKIAEKHYTNKSYKIALAEYEKFLTLYEKSPGAPYAQLMWSHTMVHLKKPKTAMREGFQSVLDYWPESHEATLAAYCIGDAYRKMGEVKSAQAAFRFVISQYPEHQIAIRSRVDLLHYARLHEDEARQLALLNDLTYQVARTEASKGACIDACHELARIHFIAQRLDEGRKALATTYTGPKLFDTVYEFSLKTINHLLKAPAGKTAAQKLGDQLLAGLRAETIKQPERAKDFLYRAAALHGTLGRPSDTWRLYGEIGERFGKDDALLGKMAEWCKSRDKRDEARRIYGQFKDVVAGRKNIAAMFLEEGKIKEAIAVFRQLIEIDGEQAGDYLWSIAGCYEKLADWKKAIATYRQVDKFPQNYFRMAACHRRMEQYKEAIVLYNQTKVIDRAAPDASLQIGFTYEQAGEREKAIRTFQLTCKRYPKSGEASRAHAHLQNNYNINVTLGGAEDE